MKNIASLDRWDVIFFFGEQQHGCLKLKSPQITSVCISSSRSSINLSLSKPNVPHMHDFFILFLLLLSPPHTGIKSPLDSQPACYLEISLLQYFFPPSHQEGGAHVQVEMGEALWFSLPREISLDLEKACKILRYRKGKI